MKHYKEKYIPGVSLSINLNYFERIFKNAEIYALIREKSLSFLLYLIGTWIASQKFWITSTLRNENFAGILRESFHHLRLLCVFLIQQNLCIFSAYQM